MAKTPAEVIAEGQRLQALSSLRGFRPGVPFGWTQEQWSDVVRKLVENALKSGVTREEIRKMGIEIP